MSFLGWLERWLETRDDPLPEKADVVIGFDFGFAKDGIKASPQSRAITEKCLEIYNDRKAGSVILSGGLKVNNRTDAEAMADILKDKVPEDKLFLEIESIGTNGNVDQSLKIMRKHGWASAIVVAQQWHARRVRATLKKMWPHYIKFSVIKARSKYGGNYGLIADNFMFFSVYDTLAFFWFRLKGYC
jgi:uncharacterized SAM-binding protein YcdF (DUF218 family)